MTDKELLELAAKAAGFNFRWFKVKQWKNMNGRIGPCRYFTGTVDVYGSHHTKPWNPLTDDGDALRLAVSLGFIVDIDTEEHYTEIEFTSNYEEKSVSEGHGFDATEATRRAITRAAAEIGKEMK